jgi:hypothetical protein
LTLTLYVSIHAHIFLFLKSQRKVVTDHLQAEIPAIGAQIEALRQERASLNVNPVFSENNSPAAIAHPYRRYASQSAQLPAQVKRIDDAIAALEARSQ